MSKELDALVLVGQAYRISHDARMLPIEDIGTHLWYIRTKGITHYPGTGEEITEERRRSLEAGEMFIELGDLAVAAFSKDQDYKLDGPNRFWARTKAKIASVSPFAENEVPAFSLTGSLWSNNKEVENGLPGMFIPFITVRPELVDDLSARWAIAEDVYQGRGTTPQAVIDFDDFVGAIASHDPTTDAPDILLVNEETGGIGEAHMFKGMLEKVGITKHMEDVPYYTTLRIDNGVEILSAALEDLTATSEGLRSLAA